MKLIRNDSLPAAGRRTDAAPIAAKVGQQMPGWRPNNAQGVNVGPLSGEQTITAQRVLGDPPFITLSRPAHAEVGGVDSPPVRSKDRQEFGENWMAGNPAGDGK
jgi:hypothetical protein